MVNNLWCREKQKSLSIVLSLPAIFTSSPRNCTIFFASLVLMIPFSCGLHYLNLKWCFHLFLKFNQPQCFVRGFTRLGSETKFLHVCSFLMVLLNTKQEESISDKHQAILIFFLNLQKVLSYFFFKMQIIYWLHWQIIFYTTAKIFAIVLCYEYVCRRRLSSVCIQMVSV